MKLHLTAPKQHLKALQILICMDVLVLDLATRVEQTHLVVDVLIGTRKVWQYLIQNLQKFAKTLILHGKNG
jgi:hypothetical protein